MQEWVDSNNNSMYSTHNECKSITNERFILTLKVKAYTKWQLIIANIILAISIN